MIINDGLRKGENKGDKERKEKRREEKRREEKRREEKRREGKIIERHSECEKKYRKQ